MAFCTDMTPEERLNYIRELEQDRLNADLDHAKKAANYEHRQNMINLRVQLCVAQVNANMMGLLAGLFDSSIEQR